MAVEIQSHVDDGAVRSGSAPDVTIVANDIGPVGGMERQLSDLIAGLLRMGHHVTVVARTCDVPEDPGLVFHRVPGPGRPFVLAHSWFLLLGSLILMRRRRGLVQANGGVVLNRADVVAVHYCHQVGPATPSRATRLFQAHVRLASVLKRWSERLCYRLNRNATFVCVSRGVAEEMRRSYPWLGARVITIHNGIDTDVFAPGVRSREAGAARARLALGEGQLVAAFVGSEWERKGLAPAIEALVHAPAWTLLVAGRGDEARYRELAQRLGVGERVRWQGVTADVQLVYQVADAFVLPSSYETFSLVTFEAAASGLPVLATPVSGVRDLLEDGENGFLITRDPAEIAARLRLLSADAALRARLGEAARRSALRYDSTRMVRGYDELYEALAAGRPS